MNYFVQMMTSLSCDLALVQQNKKIIYQSLNTDLVGDRSCLKYFSGNKVCFSVGFKVTPGFKVAAVEGIFLA